MTRSKWKPFVIIQNLVKLVRLIKTARRLKYILKKKKCYFKKDHIKKIKKISYYARQDIKIWCRFLIIIPLYINITFRIYNGKFFVRVKIKKEMIGLKFGELCFTKKKVKHSSKKSKEKKKK